MNSVRLRLISTSLAAVFTVATVYLAITQKIPVISDFFIDEFAPIDVIETPKPVEPLTTKNPPTPPPPVIDQRPTLTASNAPPVFVMLPEATRAPAEPTIIVNPQWLERPSGRDFARFYPDRAIARERTGRVVLDCLVDANGRIGCSVLSEDPAGWGFGDAALRISERFRMSPRLENGAPTEGGRVRVPINFRLE